MFDFSSPPSVSAAWPVSRTAPPVRPGPTCSGSALLPLATPRPDTVGDARAGGEEYLGLGELLDLDVHHLLRRLVPLLIISFSFVSITNKTKQLARIFRQYKTRTVWSSRQRRRRPSPPCSPPSRAAPGPPCSEQHNSAKTSQHLRPRGQLPSRGIR